MALGQRSRLPAIRLFCVLYVELIRGVPLISLLFMVSVMLPLFLPESAPWTSCCGRRSPSPPLAAACLAEVLRGGLQAVSKEQYEAADALGLTDWNKIRLIFPAHRHL